MGCRTIFWVKGNSPLQGGGGHTENPWILGLNDILPFMNLLSINSRLQNLHRNLMMYNILVYVSDPSFTWRQFCLNAVLFVIVSNCRLPVDFVVNPFFCLLNCWSDCPFVCLCLTLFVNEYCVLAASSARGPAEHHVRSGSGQPHLQELRGQRKWVS